MKPVIVVGGGWAGLAAAATLSQHGIPVTVLEASRELGGRARSIRYGDYRVDNGQHLMIGAYHWLLGMLDLVGVPEDEVLRRSPLYLCMRSPQGSQVTLSAPSSLPAPLHLIWALACAKGLTLKDRLRAIRLSAKLKSKKLTVDAEISVAQWLRQQGQSPALIKNIWHPLCIAALNTAPEQASARVFVGVIRDTFTETRKDSDLLIARTDLGRVFPEPAMHYIESHGGSVRIGQRVSGLHIDNDAMAGVCVDNQTLAAQQVIVAIPPPACLRLLSPYAKLGKLVEEISQFTYEPICTVYLHYPEDIRLGTDMLGMVGTTGQWIFDRSDTGYPGLMAVVISAQGPHMQWDNQTLCERIGAELAMLWPHWPQSHKSFVIREKYATFSCTPHSDSLRPDAVTAIKGLWLVGDYTATDYPATLEGAVRSGVNCARRLIKSLKG